MAAVNAWGSGNASLLGRFGCSATAAGVARATAKGGVFSDRFQAGASVSSPRSERTRADEGDSWFDGSRRSVIEKPGMFKLVYDISQITSCKMLK